MCSATTPTAFTSAVEADPTRPLITWYDDQTGERVELSGASLGNWVAKTANLLVDGCGLGRGDLAVVDAPAHWQTAAILLGCWSAGLWIADPSTAAGAEVGFVAADRWSARPGAGEVDLPGAVPAAETYCLGFAPLGAPMRQVPPGCADFVASVRGYGDQFHPIEPVDPDDPAIRWSDPDPGHADPPGRSPIAAPARPGTGWPAATVNHRQLCRLAADRAAELGIDPGGRVLIEVEAHPDPRDWLLAPLMVGASTVLCGRLDPEGLDRRIAAERVTTALTAGRR